MDAQCAGETIKTFEFDFLNSSVLFWFVYFSVFLKCDLLALCMETEFFCLTAILIFF